MRFFSSILTGLLLLSLAGWETDFEQAKQKATEEQKLILVNFSGSDWCGPCIQMRKEIFESQSFADFAARNLVLLNADFPRSRKNQLSKEQQKKNDLLADTYNREGHFPFTVLLDKDGKVIHSWDGLPDLSPDEFTGQLKSLLDGRK